ncbi:hypothetical protein KCU67_g14171, partial [Aureobasidium melanogenum]
MLAEHSRMYAMGEKYGVPGLKTLAIAKVQEALVRIHHAGLAAATIIAYKSTPEADKAMRKQISLILDVYGPQYVEVTEIQQIILTVPGLAYALYREALRNRNY